MANVRKELVPDAEQAGGPCVKYVQACPGMETCRYGVQDSMALAKAITNKFRDRTARLLERAGMETLKSDPLRFIPSILVDEVKPE